MKSEYVETLNTENITDGINTLEEQINQAWKINLGILPRGQHKRLNTKKT